MSIYKRYSVKKAHSGTSETDKNELFVRRQGMRYFLRHISRYSALGKTELTFATWLLGCRKVELGQFIASFLPAERKEVVTRSLTAPSSDAEAFGSLLAHTTNDIPIHHHFRITKFIKQSLKRELRLATYRGKSEIEKNSLCAQRMFGLERHEIDVVIFFFLIGIYGYLEDLFDRKLRCDLFSGRKYLNNILDLSPVQTAKTLARLERLGIVNNSPHSISLDDDVLSLLQNPDHNQISNAYFKRIRTRTVALDSFFFSQEKIAFLQALIDQKTDSPTHVLFYGPPGTGKTSLACAVAQSAGIPAYTILGDEDNRSSSRRTALVACMNMTTSGNGSIILVDEADNLLNTMNAWQFRGETQDKGWLNDIMEKPGTRTIWITNTTDGIEESVLRRFAYMLEFKSFNTRQRVVLFEKIIRAHCVKRFFSQSDIQALAKKYCVTAGPIDMAVKKAKKTAAGSRLDFHNHMRLSLDAYLALKRAKKSVNYKADENSNYTLEGLNLSDNVHQVIDQLKMINSKTYHPRDRCEGGMALLFHGPPGTGKTALANHMGKQLGRDVMNRRYSDIQSMWLGEGEKNIRKAFSEAYTEEAILIVDEVDSMLMHRDRAVRSWEISFANEFLVQMESFNGILICTTNRLKGLDPAAIRRFMFKIEFDFLTSDGNLIFYRKLLQPLLGKRMGDACRNQIAGIRHLTPGDFNTVRKRSTFTPKHILSHEKMIRFLAEEARIKAHHAGKPSIGF